MDSEAQAAGRDQVRTHLLARWDEAGLRRPKGMAVQTWDEMRKRLVEHLAYMHPENLVTLAEVILDAAVGPHRDTCPSEVTVRNVAHGLQPQPFGERRIVTSWLSSIEGPQAEAGGYLVELYRFLRRSHRPPLPHDARTIREEAEANRRMLDLALDRQRRGVATAEDLAWIAAYRADEREARALVEAGSERRVA